MPHADNDPDVLAAINNLYKIAANNDNSHLLDLRIRATLALTMFLPSPTATRELTQLIDSPEVPNQIRQVAADSLNRRL